jgi:serine O-acetyltransferase
VFETIRADLQHARRVNGCTTGGLGSWLRILLRPGSHAVLAYRFAAWSVRRRMPVLRHLAVAVSTVVRYLVEIVTGVEISPWAEIGPGLVVHTVNGVYVATTRIGRNCIVQHGVVISDGVRHIGDDVYFGPGAKVIGRAAIGNNVRVVANSLVMTDVEDNLTVIGVPARIRWRNRSVAASIVASLMTMAPPV